MATSLVTIVSTIIGSGALSSVISVCLDSRLSQRLEREKAGIEKGLYVSKAHYDLELESFKSLWVALSDLRLKVRAFRGPEKFQLLTQNGLEQEWFAKSLLDVTKDFFAAHDNAVRVIGKSSPFYPEAIKRAAECTHDIDMKIIQKLGRIDDTPLTSEWLAELKEYSGAMDRQVSEVEDLIRLRLESLRIIS